MTWYKVDCQIPHNGGIEITAKTKLLNDVEVYQAIDRYIRYSGLAAIIYDMAYGYGEYAILLTDARRWSMFCDEMAEKYYDEIIESKPAMPMDYDTMRNQCGVFWVEEDVA